MKFLTRVPVREELKKSSIRKAIREKCLDCCCGQSGEVIKCNIRKCSLWPYRLNIKSYEDTNIAES